MGSAISSVGRAISGAFKWIGNKIYNGVKKIGNAIYNGVKKVGKAIYNGVKWAFKGIYNGMVWIGKKLYQVAKYIYRNRQKIINGILYTVDKVKVIINGVSKTIEIFREVKSIFGSGNGGDEDMGNNGLGGFAHIF